MKKTDDYYIVDLKEIFHALWHRFWMIILAAVICGGVIFSYAAFCIVPIYKAEARLYVNNSSFSVGSTSFSFSSSDLTAAKSLVETYIVILESRLVINEVIEEAEVKYSYREMLEMIEADSVNNTEVFAVTVTSTDPEEAEIIANAIVEVLPDKIADVVDGSNVKVVDYAVVPSAKAAPNVTLYTAGGILLGVFIAVLIIIIQLFNDTKIHNEDYLAETYELPILAVIPDLFGKNRNDYYSGYSVEYYSGEEKE